MFGFLRCPGYVSHLAVFMCLFAFGFDSSIEFRGDESIIEPTELARDLG